MDLFQTLSVSLGECLKFTSNHSLDECLAVSRYLVETSELGDENPEEFFRRAEEMYFNPGTLKARMWHVAIAYIGVHSLYAGFLFLSGDSVTADLRSRIGKIKGDKAMAELMEMVKNAKPVEEVTEDFDEDDLEDYPEDNPPS